MTNHAFNILGYVALTAVLAAWFFISDGKSPWVTLAGTIVIFGAARLITEYRKRKKL
jgi:hypothetical protein